MTATATATTRLSHAFASEIVKDWVARCGASVRFKHEWRDSDVRPQCTSLCLEPRTNRSRRAAHDLREALAVWVAASCCRGFGFCENPTFWYDSMRAPRLYSLAKRRVYDAVGVFPRVILEWNSLDDDSSGNSARPLRRLERFLDAFFGSPPPHSEAFRACMAALCPFVVADRWQQAQPVVCELIVALSGRQPPIASVASMARVLDRAATTTTNRATLGNVDVTLARVAHRMRYTKPPSIDYVQSWLATTPCGVATSVEIGDFTKLAHASTSERHAVLTALTHVDEVTFGYRGGSDRSGWSASLCSLLPYAPCLRRLQIDVPSLLEVVWVLFAMHHPVARQQSAWRELDAWSRRLNDDEHAVLQLFVAHGCPASIVALATDMLGGVGEFDFEEKKRAQSRLFEVVSKRLRPTQRKIRTATSVGDAPLYSDQEGGEDERPTLVVAGTPIELIDVWDDVTALPSIVRVIAAGYGLGWMATRDLRNVQDLVMDLSLSETSCVTTMKFYKGGKPAQLLSLVGTQLIHVRGMAKLTWHHLLALELRELRSLQTCKFTTSEGSSETASSWRSQLPMLETLAIRVDLPQLPALVRTLLEPAASRTGHSATHTRCFSYLRFDINVPMCSTTATDPAASCATQLTSQLDSLLHHRHGVRALEVRLRHTQNGKRVKHLSGNDDVKPACPIVARLLPHFPRVDAATTAAKRAFLSCCRSDGSDGSRRRDACAALRFDSGVRQLVLDFVGRGLDAFSVGCSLHQTCLMDGRVYRGVYFWD